MSCFSRNKGIRGELELFALLSDHLGTLIQRSLSAPREGGADSLAVDGWAIEVKRTEKFLHSFWFQALDQAEKERRRPVLFWRPSRAPWTAYIDLHDLNPDLYSYRGQQGPAAISVSAWSQLVREISRKP